MVTINNKDFDSLNKKLKQFDALREEVILASRKILQLSKQIIYALHRSDEVGAKKHVDSIEKELSSMQKIAEKDSQLKGVGAYRIAEQEYVEAISYYYILKEGTLPTSDQLKVEVEHYLLGVCDLSGELVRRAINQMIKGKSEDAEEMRELLSTLYGTLLEFDFRNGELRKKFDGIKYDLNKLEDLAVRNLK